MPLITNPPPPTPVDPVTEVLHGVPVTDPYRWLEDQNSPRTRKWVDEQTAYTRAYLDALPGRHRIRKRVEELLAVEAISELRKVGNRYLYLKRSPYQEQPVIVMREGDSGAEIVLVDPSKRTGSTTTTVKIIAVSRNGDLLAYGIGDGADSFRTVEFLDIDRKQVLPDRLPRSFNAQLQFSADGRGYYYSYELFDTPRLHYRAVYWHEFGASPREDVEVFVAGEDATIHLKLLASVNGHLLAYLVSLVEHSTVFDFYIHNVAKGEPAKKILEHLPPVFLPFFVGDQLFALSDWKAPNLRIVTIDPGRPERDHWLDVIPESEHCIKNLTFVGDFVCVGYVEDLSSQIEIFDRTGRRHGRVPCPPQGSARPLWQPLEKDTLLYEFSSFQQSPTIFSYHIASGEQRVWAKNSVKFDPCSIEVEQARYKSKDGTIIPIFLVARKGLRSSGPLPTFLGAYGGFGVSRTPQFNAYSTFLIESGFLFAFAHVRGGGEFGEEWHRAGKRHNRQNAFDDFIAAAEWLISQGHSIADKIAIGGGSNAGLLTAAVLTQRPTLFRAVVCMGPLLDMLRYHRFDTAHIFIDEYGSPDRADDFSFLFAYSPYHRVEEQSFYPSVMLISGDEDTCCNPMHARKMAARLQAATKSGRPILLDYKAKWGHVSVQPLTQRIEALTDRLAFIFHELGVTV